MWHCYWVLKTDFFSACYTGFTGCYLSTLFKRVVVYEYRRWLGVSVTTDLISCCTVRLRRWKICHEYLSSIEVCRLDNRAILYKAANYRGFYIKTLIVFLIRFIRFKHLLFDLLCDMGILRYLIKLTFFVTFNERPITIPVVAS